MKRTILSLMLVLALAATLPAGASTFVAMDHGELVAASDAVVVGQVTDVRSFWNEDATAIVTEASLVVTETLAGQAPGVVVVRTFGGQVGAVRIEAHGFPTFQKGQRLALFLEGAGDVARVVGYQQGQYRVITRKSDGVEVAVPAVDQGAHLVHLDGRVAPAPRALTLDALRSSVSQADRPAADLRDSADLDE